MEAPSAPPEHALLAAQRSAGNAAVSRLLARSPMAPPGPVGELKASIPLLGYEETEQASAVRELALGPAATFQGFESEEEAAVAAAGTKMVGVVVADAEGRFHAYETDVEPVWGPIFSDVRHFEIAGGHVMRWTRLDTSADVATIEEQIKLAEQRVRGGRDEEARTLFLGVLEHGLGLAPDELHDATGGKALPGKVSFDLAYTDANAHAGVTGALPADRDSVLPEPTLVIGPGSFSSLVALRATVLHEFTHVHHAEQALAALRRWRATTKDGSFHGWLKREKQAGRVGALDYAIITEQFSGATPVTEALSYLVSFMAAYELTDLSRIPEGDEIADGFVFGKLGQLADEWTSCNDVVVQEHVTERLLAYRDTLDEPHRRRLASRARNRHDAAADGSSYRDFYAPLM